VPCNWPAPQVVRAGSSIRAFSQWILQQTASLPQGSDPEYFRRQLTASVLWLRLWELLLLPSYMRLLKGSDVHRAISCGLQTLCVLAASTAPGAYSCGLGSDVPDRPLYTTVQQACSHPASSIDGTCLCSQAAISVIWFKYRRLHLAWRGYIDSLQWLAGTKLTRDGDDHRHSSLNAIHSPWGLGCKTDTGTAPAMLLASEMEFHEPVRGRDERWCCGKRAQQWVCIHTHVSAAVERLTIGTGNDLTARYT
jgi:hypothetical protein